MVKIKKVLQSDEKWEKEFNKRYDYIKRTIGERECFLKTVDVALADGEVTMNIADYIVNLIVWKPMIKFKMIPTIDYIMDCSNLTQGTIKNYIDSKYVRPLRNKVNMETLNLEMIEIIEREKTIVEDFGIVMGITYNYYQIIQMCKKNPRFRELIHAHIPKGIQPNEIESYGKSLLNEGVEILKKSKTGLAPLLNSGAGINLGQFQELLFVIGNKPDLDGNTYPVPIDTNIMIGGLDTPSHFTLDATGGRKAQIMNKKYTGKSGYFARKLNLLTIDTVLDPDPESDCHTHKLLEYHIDDMDSLLRLEGRYYKLKPNSKIYRIIKHTDTILIGRTIYLRSPMYCAGDKICRKCYGELYNVNHDINIGLIASTTISSRFTQNILSAKHSLMTKSQKITLPEGYDKYFILDGNQVLLDFNNIETDVELFLTVNVNDLETDIVDEYDEDEVNLNVYEEILCNKCYITTSDPHNIIMTLQEEHGMEMKTSEYMKDMIDKYSKKKKFSMIPLDKIDENEVLFAFDVRNHELTKTLNQVKGILEQEDHGGYTDMDELIYKFNRLLIDGKIYSHLVHAEVICRNLMRDVDNIMERPNFVKGKDTPYQIFTVKKALMKHPSPIVSISFERVEEQLKSVLTFKKKKSSMLDKLFMESYKQEYQLRRRDLENGSV